MFNKKHAIIAVFFLFLSMGYFYSVFDGSSILTERDLAVFFMPPRWLWVNILKGGEFPLWNPYYYSGHPLFATLQPGVLYPINALLLILPFDLAFNWTIIIHFPLAAIFTYMFLRELNASVAGAVAGALTFMLGGYLFSVHNVVSTLFSAVWAPLILFLFLRALRRSSFPYAALAGVFLVVMFLGGGIETLYGTFIMLGFLCVFPSVFEFNGTAQSKAFFVKRLSLFMAAIAVFLLFGAVQIIPFLEVAGRSTRSGGLKFLEATTWSFDVKDFIQFFIADPYGYLTSEEKYWANQSWLKTVYTGFIPFILTAVFFIDKKGRSLAFIMLALVSLTFAMGRNSSLYGLLYAFMPFLSKFRYPVKFIFIFFILLSVSTAIGYDSLKKRLDEKDGAIKRLCLLLLALSTAGAVAFGLMQYYSEGVVKYFTAHGIDYPEYTHANINIFNIKRAIFFFIAASLVIYAGFRSSRLRRAMPYMLVSVLTVDLFFAHQGYYTSSPSAEYHKPGKVMEFVKKDAGLSRVFVTPKTKTDPVSVPEDGSFDINVLKSLDMSKERLLGHNLERGVFDIDGLDVIRRADYMELYSLIVAQKRIDATNVLAMLNVKYAVSIPKIDSKEFRLASVVGAVKGDLKRLEETKSLKIYENLNYLPRFYTVENYKLIKEAPARLTVLARKDFNPAAAVVLEEDPWGGKAPEDLKSGEHDSGAVTVKEYRNNSFELDVNMPRSGILVASESYYPGWKAYVDGKERKVLKANHALRAVALEKGAHTVRFVYSPWSFKAGAIISAASALALIIAGALYFIWQKAGQEGSRLRTR